MAARITPKTDKNVSKHMLGSAVPRTSGQFSAKTAATAPHLIYMISDTKGPRPES